MSDPRTTSPIFGKLTAPQAWQTVDLISDLHLQASESTTFQAWRDYMASTTADAVFILGDLFEVWVGDDAVEQDPFLASCAEVLRQAAHRMHLAFMPGNRDFLVGSTFLSSCGMHALSDPCVLEWGAKQILLSHGDALCLGDVDYQAFREQVRGDAWQQDFLAKPLAERVALARAMRAQSETQKNSQKLYADADPTMALNWLSLAAADTLVHGHTHQPADHPLGTGMRHVLSDWSLDHEPLRAQVLRLDQSGGLRRLDITNAKGF
ncbi:UDP-2,3-diacylglucosamine diphosphatase [Limnohabitans sp. Rim8]|uniref:UDP-2,3-diacylglucosamine diphosphatase n=1 Tax=Limnohabitans sp. Rim8 TaxID=1100718 RepID=UPI002633E0AA|nr:UDP-2,3-diacylglucosamine diphosphatase [Limnohabitans sp. Rim8]